jgi:hypothetical protein
LNTEFFWMSLNIKLKQEFIDFRSVLGSLQSHDWRRLNLEDKSVSVAGFIRPYGESYYEKISIDYDGRFITGCL